MDAIRQVIRKGRFNSIAVVVSLIVGAFSGYNESSDHDDCLVSNMSF